MCDVRPLATLLLAATIAFGATGCASPTVERPAPPVSASERATPSPQAPETPTATAAPETAATTGALELLATLAVKGKAPKTGYDRAGMFGQAWLDVDRNGCDTRNDILARDLVDEVLAGSCRVLSGTLLDPFTGGSINFVRGQGTSELVHIEHVVALSNAWQTGAQQLDQTTREAFANDPMHLIAVDGPTNSAKGDNDASGWLPPNKAFRCQYVSIQVQVKAKYGLWVTPAEGEAMAGVLSGCSGLLVEVSPAPAAPVAPVDPVAPVPAPAPLVDETAFVHPGGYCSELGAVGASESGRSYTCGKNGADAGGRFHWNS